MPSHRSPHSLTILSLLTACAMSLCAGCIIESGGEQLDEREVCDGSGTNPRCSGGETTSFEDNFLGFRAPSRTLDDRGREEFRQGREVFEGVFQHGLDDPFSFGRGGLGPRFNDSSCGGCHAGNGRANPYGGNEQPSPGLIIRVSWLDDQGVAHPLSQYGSQLQPFGTGAMGGEVTTTVEWTEEQGVFGGVEEEGTYTLVRPEFSFFEPAHGTFEQGFVYSPRATPPMIGLGLLEAIPEGELLAQVDPDDEDGDGISGRANFEVDPESGERMMGRFGWKASHATLRTQNAAAMLGDIGVVSGRVGLADCGQVAVPSSSCRSTDGVTSAEVEIDDASMDALDFFTRHIAPPAALPDNSVEDFNVRGQELFEEAQCSACHTPSWTTAQGHFEPALAGQQISPYTDLLLHDMGEGLADGRPDGEASGREWRTPPLWGIGLTEFVNGHTRFLHDGRARNLEEAILWHGGEAEASKEAFRTMSFQERVALLEFVRAL